MLMIDTHQILRQRQTFEPDAASGTVSDCDILSQLLNLRQSQPWQCNTASTSYTEWEVELVNGYSLAYARLTRVVEDDICQLTKLSLNGYEMLLAVCLAQPEKGITSKEIIMDLVNRYKGIS